MCSSNTTELGAVKTLQYVVHIPTFLLGLLVNSAALWILCFRLKKWTESVIYMINLITSDVFLLFSLPFKVYASVEDKWHLGSRFCEFVESLYFVNTYGTMLIIMLISLDRYIAIKHPFPAKSLRSPKKALLACTVLWVCVWAASIPNYLQSNPQTGQCFAGFSEFWERGVIPLTMLSVFLIVAVVLTFCSTQIIRTLKRAGEGSTRTSVNIISSNLVTFLLCFTPYHVAMFLYFLVRRRHIAADHLGSLRLFLQTSQCLATTNCCLDAMYYYLIIKEFWKSKDKRMKHGVSICKI
ncbi:G-protein coupled receptor 55-like [Narcine bancroftii]|uniref:G-protein coupled receptor 55-like n=1 Tax=Narcine bancroftii TaxID=1343680 RepID=UPI0038317769